MLAGLLVSVRSVVEARAAVLGGATVIDIKEPRLGPLGRASPATWRAIRAEVPAEVPVSVALGELADLDLDSIRAADLNGIAFQKAGPARSQRTWPARWDQAINGKAATAGWVAVIYADWERADAPHPDLVLAAALTAPNCPGILVDSWDKRLACPITAENFWADRIAWIHESGRFVALAGRLDLAAIRRLGPLRPDLFAVRGAACAGGDRQAGVIDAHLVAQLVVTAAAGAPPSTI